MDERLELATGAILAALAVLAGLAFWARPERGAGGDGGAALPADLAPVGATGLEGVPDFGDAATADELAILAPLDRGSAVEGWTIEQIDAIEAGALVVHVTRGGSRMSFPIASSLGNRIAPPIIVGPYSIYMTNLHGDLATSDAAMAVAHALEAVLSANSHVPVPATLAPYAPDPE